MLIPQEFRGNKPFLLKVIKWALIGLLVRVIIMPFTMDPDLLWINYIPHQLAAGRIWDPYTFAKANFPGRLLDVWDVYYPPLTLYLLAFFQSLLQKFTPTLQSWFAHYAQWLKLGGGYALGHVTFGADEQLFRILFVLKAPLLLFDFAIGFMLLRLVRDWRKALFVFRLWMLNPVTLYSAYGYGQIDIYATFFVVLAVILAVYGRKGLAIISLCAGVLIKSFPLILLPAAIVYLGRGIKEMVKLSFIAIAAIVLVYLPVAISSKGYALVSIFPGGTIGTSNTSIYLTIFKVLFFLSTVMMLIFIWREKKKDHRSFSLENYFFLTLLLFFAFQPICVRFYTWITPLLFLQFTRERNLWKIALIQFLILAELRLCATNLWCGLFSPLHPTFFHSLPIPDTIIAGFVDVFYTQRILYRLFILITLYMVYRAVKQIRSLKKEV